jgi:hypothetical protein
LKKELLSQMKNQKIVEKQTFWSWLHRYRLKVVILAFVILLPLALVFTAYVGSYTANRKVYFDSDMTEETEIIKDFMSPDEMDALSLNIVWSELKHPTTLPDSDELAGGYLKFTMSYVANENYLVKNVSVIPVLQTDWKNVRSLGNSSVVDTFDRTITVPFNYELPFNPLLFITVSEPNLYLRVSYTVSSSGNDVNYIDYVHFPLKDINPLNVVN